MGAPTGAAVVAKRKDAHSPDAERPKDALHRAQENQCTAVAPVALDSQEKAEGLAGPSDPEMPVALAEQEIQDTAVVQDSRDRAAAKMAVAAADSQGRVVVKMAVAAVDTQDKVAARAAVGAHNRGMAAVA